MRLKFVSITAASAIALASAAPAMGANQAIILSGLGGAAMPDMLMTEVLGGMFRGYERQGVAWPQPSRPFGPIPITLGGAIAVGADNLDAAIDDALTRIGPGEHVTVVGLSAGSLVVDEELRRLAADPEAPDKGALNFIVVGDSSRFSFNEDRHDKLIDFTYAAPADTKYDTTVVAAEYDGFADYPDRQWNLLAVCNAIAGEMLLHVPSMFTDLSDAPADSITVTTNELGGVTTNYLLPSDNLPLVSLLPLLVIGQPTLKDIVDSAYVRNDDTAVAASTAAPVEAVAVDSSGPSVSAPEETIDPADSSDPSVSAPAETIDPADIEEPADAYPTVDEPVAVGNPVPGRSSSTTPGDSPLSDHQAPSPRSPRTGRGSQHDES